MIDVKSWWPRALLLCLLLLAGGCRLVITTDHKGQILSTSGRFDCSQAECAFEITEQANDTLTALPAEGYRFVRWKGLCTRFPTPVCELSVAPLPEEHSEFDGDVSVWAVFESTTRVRPWFRDRDGDHFGSPLEQVMSASKPPGHVMIKGDCDDSDASVRPHVRERHDGRDTNCNGKVDEGFSNSRFFEDADGDGFGNPIVSTLEREAPAGYVDNSLDCNDADADDHPDAPERADGRDNDCDGTVDEALMRYYRDVDGDGFGGQQEFMDAFEPLPGYVDNDADCDDGNPAISPAATEVVDSADNDCDGLVDEGFSPRSYYRDRDGDGLGDANDIARDIQAPPGYVTVSGDNCVDAYNPEQSDVDGDGLGDACDPVDDRVPPDEEEAEEEQDTGSGSSDGGAAGDCSLSGEMAEMLEAVNSFRATAQTCGTQSYAAAPPLAWSCELGSAALAHSSDMASQDFMGHQGSDGSSPGDRVSLAGYNWSGYGENVAAGYVSVSAVIQAWINSPGHCSNLMHAGFEDFGAASVSNAASTYGIYWTQVFGSAR